MATPRTGRARGRPRKDAPQPKKTSRGRPPKGLANDPERYRLALAGAIFRDAYDRGISELRAAESFCKLTLMVDSQDNFARLLIGERVDLYKPFPLGTVLHGPKTPWRDANEYRPHAHNLAAKIRRLRRRDDPDGHWLQAMSLAWLHCLRGNMDKIENARRFAAFCGKSKYFEEVMRPTLIDRHETLSRQPKTA